MTWAAKDEVLDEWSANRKQWRESGLDHFGLPVTQSPALGRLSLPASAIGSHEWRMSAPDKLRSFQDKFATVAGGTLSSAPTSKLKSSRIPRAQGLTLARRFTGEVAD